MRCLWRRSLGRIYRERVPTIHDPIMTHVTIHDLIRLQLENLAAKSPKKESASPQGEGPDFGGPFTRTSCARPLRLASPRHATPRQAWPGEASERARVFFLIPLNHTHASGYGTSNYLSWSPYTPTINIVLIVSTSLLPYIGL